MVEQIGKGPFKAKTHPLIQRNCFGEPGSDCAGTWAFENADSTVSNRTGRNGIEGTEVEHAAARKIRDVAIANAVWPLESAAIRKTQVPGIVA